jgi:hypothetical protein
MANTKAQNLLESIELEPKKVTYFIHKGLKEKYLTDNLFFEYLDEIDLTKLDFTIYTMPLVLNIISTIWISGETFTIDAMDRDLYTSLITVKEIFKRLYPSTSWHGELVPMRLVDNPGPVLAQPTDTIALHFSHGLDSLCTSLIHRNTPQLLITVRGMQDMSLGQKEDERWTQTQHLVSHFASVHSQKITYVNSNFHDFFNWKILNNLSPEIKQWRLYAVEDLGWMGLAAPLLTARGCNKLLLVSNIGGTAGHPGASNPMIAQATSFAGITCKIDSFEKSRLDKNKAIADICNTCSLEKPYTLVCTEWLSERKNCCKCQKCCITMLSFLVLGENPQAYGFERDLEDFFNYYKNIFFLKNRYCVYRSGWNKDIQKVARERFALMDPQLQDFFSWYNTIDFDTRTLPNSNITVDYTDFKDLYKGDPLESLNPQCSW